MTHSDNALATRFLDVIEHDIAPLTNLPALALITERTRRACGQTHLPIQLPQYQCAIGRNRPAGEIHPRSALAAV